MGIHYKTTLMAKDILMFDQIDGFTVTYLRKIPLSSVFSGVVLVKLEKEYISYTEEKGYFVDHVQKKRMWYDANRDEVEVFREEEED